MDKSTNKNKWEKEYPEWQKYLKVKKNYNTLKGDGSRQLMVYRKNASDDPGFTRWIGDLRKKLRESGEKSDVSIVSICGTCDNSLLLLTGKGVETFIKTEAAKKGNQKSRQTAVEGEDNVVYFSSNLKLVLPKAKLKGHEYKSGQEHKPFNRDLPIVNVAVFDTGLVQGEIDIFLINGVLNPCIPGAARGWNFTVPNDKYDDDNPGTHGTNVSRFIVDRALKESGNPVRIIPVKIHNKNGKSDLYSVLCGFAYAKQQGAHIINASFGYYAPIMTPGQESSGEYCVNLFRNFIKNQLTDNGILLIAAAGNEAKKSEISNDFRKLYTIPADVKNLDLIRFYPASFATEFSNVIAVTTVNDKGSEVSPTQNFSPNVVDIGVKADEPGGFGFINPRTADSFIYGSSFATPLLTGVIAGNYSLFNGSSNKKELIETLLKKGTLNKNPDLETKIKQGTIL